MADRLVAILGPDYCGSTYAGYVLGCHDNMSFVSESIVFKNDVKSRCINCEKNKCTCNIWTDELRNVDESVWFNSILNRFKDTKNTEILVSTDKHAEAFAGKTHGCEVVPIVFFRDPVSIMSTYKMHHIMATKNKKVLSYKDKTLNTIEKILDYLEGRYDAIDRYIKEFKSVLFIDHDYLTAYKNTFRLIFDFIGEEFDDKFLEFWKYDHHVVGGNMGVHLQSKEDRHTKKLMFPDIMNEKKWYLWNSQSRDINVDYRWKVIMKKDEIFKVINSRLYKMYLDMHELFIQDMLSWINKNNIQET